MSYELIAILVTALLQLVGLAFIIYHATRRVSPGEAAILLRQFQQSAAIGLIDSKVEELAFAFRGKP